MPGKLDCRICTVSCGLVSKVPSADLKDAMLIWLSSGMAVHSGRRCVSGVARARPVTDSTMLPKNPISGRPPNSAAIAVMSVAGAAGAGAAWAGAAIGAGAATAAGAGLATLVAAAGAGAGAIAGAAIAAGATIGAGAATGAAAGAGAGAGAGAVPDTVPPNCFTSSSRSVAITESLLFA